VEPTSDGGFAVLGDSNEKNYSEFWLLKIDSNGCMGSYCGLQDTNCYYQPYPDCITTVLEHSSYDIDVKLYPNPTTETITIEITTKKHQLQSITLYDITGKAHLSPFKGGVCDHCAQAGDEITLNLKELPQGIYICHITLTNGHTLTRKIIKQ
jgi:hypothetical protein